ISYRHFNSIHRVSRTNGDIVWRLGGAFSDFNFVNDAGFSAQHNVRMINDSTISLFDNGNMANPQLSRGVVYELDLNNMEATLTRTYGDNIGLYSPAMGSFQLLPGNLGLISWGQQLAPLPALTLLNANGEGLSGLNLDFPYINYRTNFILKADYTLPDRPGISCSSSPDGDQLLSVEAGWEGYEWSTGEESATIAVSSNGYYQYWVDQGDGKLGSYVVEVTDGGIEGCLVTSISEPIDVQSTKVIAYYNLQGQRLEKAPKQQAYIVHYEDGRAELKAIID
ncbi:MAG: arylsulfotransferase family protein, partial [Bacteroidota bacterium]